MKFAFVVHPLSEESKALFQMDDGGELLSHWEKGNLLEICNFVQGTMAEGIAFGGQPAATGPTVLDRFQHLETPAGKSAEGRVYEIPCTAREILQDPALAIQHTLTAVRMAADWGAGIVGLGSLTSVVGGHGKYIAENSPIPVTTGNSLTVYAAIRNLHQACSELDIDIRRETVTVVGIPGSIATAVARLLAPEVGRLVLVARRQSPRAVRIAKELQGDLVLDIPSALSQAQLILSATSSGNCIKQEMLQSGSIVIDVGVPTDVTRAVRHRDNVLIVAGGVVDVPKPFLSKSMLLGFHFGLVPGCLAETINLALEDRAECFSLGRDLGIERVNEIGAIAQANGFTFSQLSSFGRPVEQSMWASMTKVIRRQRSEERSSEQKSSEESSKENGEAIQETTAPCLEGSFHGDLPQHNGNGNGNGKHVSGRRATKKNGDTRQLHSGLESDPSHAVCGDHKKNGTHLDAANRRARTLFHRYINPVLVSLAEQGGLNKTFVRGDGVIVSDSEGNHYLDFVSGFGALNLGHNHPRVVGAVREALSRQVPGFCQSAVNPHAAALAERLVSVSPAGLEMVFFCNSGTEAVEAALKLARVATGRTGIVYCHGSFHGKSIGALSVTGNRSYQRPFEPLLPDCHAVPYGNLEALERVLASQNMAALIVEPIQGEAGMIMPPVGYLAEVERLCRNTGTLLIADEVQTGMGRTGTMFASEQAAIEPDIMTVAKSLSGGLVPIGAMLARRDLWMKAYGTVDRFALHTSTFGGGSLACVAGLATVDTLIEEHLPENAAQRGFQLLEGLNKLKQRMPDYFCAVRGQGLMIGVELTPLTESVVTHLKRTDSSGMVQYLMSGVDEMIRSFPTVFQMQILLEHYHIYSQIARSNPLVLRIQPPLTIDEAKTDHFLSSFGRTCTLGQKVEGLFDEVITRSISGQHKSTRAAEADRNAIQNGGPQISTAPAEIDEQFSS